MQLNRYLVMKALGDVDDAVIAKILALGATTEELALAQAWSAMLNSLDHPVQVVVSTRQAAELVLGASPRAEVLLMLAAKTAAAFDGRDYVTPDDVKGLLRPAFRHRLLLRPEAEVGGQTADSLLDSVIARVTPPR